MKKEKIITIILVIMTIFLIGTIFYFSYLLMEAPTGNNNSSAIAPKKTKAQVETGEKFIALNQLNNLSLTPSLSPTATSENLSPSSTPEIKSSITPTTTTLEESPTPTEIILAKANSPTDLATNSSYLSPTRLPTEVKNLPSSGYFNSLLVIFGVASFLIFYSFIF